MNIKFITGWTIDSDTDTVSSVATSNLALCGQGRAEGNAGGMVPLKLADGIVVTPVTTITSSTSTTKRGSRSAVIKVEIPYTALTKDSGGNLTTDPTRSGGTLSMHVVIAIPAATTKDLQGVNGPVSQHNAEAHIAVVNFLLNTLIGKQFGSMPSFDVTSNTWCRQHTKYLSPADSIIDLPATDEAAPVPTPSVGGYDGVGFDLTKVRIYKGLNSALSRIANNLPALSCGDVGPDSQDFAYVRHDTSL